jgi:hypothetical protein
MHLLHLVLLALKLFALSLLALLALFKLTSATSAIIVQSIQRYFLLLCPIIAQHLPLLRDYCVIDA